MKRFSSTSYEVMFKDAKKDKNGFAKILVRFGDFCVPMLGKPVALVKDDIAEVSDCKKDAAAEINRLNLTRWVLKDIPAVAKVLSESLANGKESWLFYYNGAEGTWKFWDAPFAGIDEGANADEFDEKLDKLDSIIDSVEDDLYCPHIDKLGNYGDESVHAVYSRKALKKIIGKDDDSSGNECCHSEDASELDLVAYVKQVPSIVGKARMQHKKIPYAEIGKRAFDMVSSTLSDEELGKLIFNLAVELCK